MKKLLVLLSCIAGLTFTSCKKDYICRCTTRDGGTSLSTTSYTVRDTKKNATKKCTGAGSNSGPGTTLTVSCSLTNPL